MPRGRPREHTDLISEVVRLYIEEKLSAVAIAKCLSISQSSILRYLHREGIQMEARLNASRKTQ
jgi:predicted transcriptional regulator